MIDRITAKPKILHQDKHLLVVSKPPGLPTTAPDTNTPCLVNWVTEQLGGGVIPHATSRLDSPVSGIVTFALTPHANRHLLGSRRTKSYARIYLGISTRGLPFIKCEWSWPISIDPRNKKQRIAGPGTGERDALTRCERAAQSDFATVLRLEPVTGRTHQLRVHAAEGGVPLFGDHAYGGDRRVVLPGGTVVTARRVMLHCARVRFPNPSGRGVLDLVAPVRTDMVDVWMELGGDPAELRPDG